jgi:23S rRNA (cytosine1962-C5)-methyltransferase
MKTLQLLPGRERALLRRHPWIFDGAIDTAASERAGAGETVRIADSRGQALAVAAFSPQSKIRARVWSFDPQAIVDHRFFKNAVRAARDRRRALPIASDARRWIHGEADGLPGLIVDAYGDIAVAQFTACGVERHKAAIVAALQGELGVRAVYERSDSSLRRLEGLEPCQGWLAGEAPLVVPFTEHGLRYEADIAAGHKTGFYLDQRDNRALFARIVESAALQRVLNCYCYTGGFTLAALAGGAQQVLSIDSSAAALEQARRHVALNGFEPERAAFDDADVNRRLRELREAGERFDAVVLDPPKFAPSAAHVAAASRAYKDINRLALHLLRPGGFLFTFSCSGGVDATLFQQIVAAAASEARVDAAIVARVGAGADHPHTLAFGEGEYLKGLLLQLR